MSNEKTQKWESTAMRMAEEAAQSTVVVTFTTAPSDYDWMGTQEMAVVGTTGGKTVRQVATPARHATGQRDRYESGLHMAVDLAEWKKRVQLGLATEIGAFKPERAGNVTMSAQAWKDRA